jgi:drug/metabolite transporter (DMT)-like permease
VCASDDARSALIRGPPTSTNPPIELRAEPRALRAAGGLACAASSACLFASKGLFIKFLYADGWDYETVLTVRSLLALPVVALWALWMSPRHAFSRAPAGPLLGACAAGLLSYYAGALADFRALALIDASIERVLLFTYPSIVVLLHALIRRRWPRPAVFVALSLTYGGILLVVSGLSGEILRSNGFGALLVLGCACVFALYYLASERWTVKLGSMVFTTAALASATLGLCIHFALAHAWPQMLAPLRPRDLALMAGLVLVATVAPMFLMVEGVRRLGAQRAALISTIGPPATIALAALLLGERLAPAQWCGVALIGAGILVLELRPTADEGSLGQTP